MSDKFTDGVDAIRKEYDWFYPIIVGAGFVIVLIIIGWQLFGTETPVFSGNLLAYAMNLWSSGVSIGVGVFIIDQINRRRDRLATEAKDREQKAEAEKAEKQRLIIELRSRDNTTALTTLEHIKEKGWDKDGTLERATLWGSSLQNASLGGADLKEAIFNAANLQLAFLVRTNLQGAKLSGANLKEAYLQQANLQEADLQRANLQGAFLVQAKLQGADLQHANLKGAILKLDDLPRHMARFDEKTILPDAENVGHEFNPIYDKYWTPETDMRRYTDPNHPDFWQPEWAKKQQQAEQ